MKELEDIAKDLPEVLGTMKMMIYSLKQAIDDIMVGLGGNRKDLVDTAEWEKQCREAAKEMYFKEENNEVQE